MEKLLSNLGKKGVDLGLFTKKVDIEDTEYLSKYFILAEYSPVLTAGRNPISFNGSSYLKPGSEIQVECLDSAGNSLYIERAKAKESSFSDITTFVISIHVYDETYSGLGKLVFVGTTKKGEIVRWIGKITIDKTLSNAAKVRFYYTPTLSVRPLLYPVVDLGKASTRVPPPVYTAPTVSADDVTIVVTIGSITIVDGGSGYTTAPFVKSTGGGAPDVALVATVSNGKIVSISTGTQQYTSTPTIVIDTPSDPAGTKAKAIAQLTGKVTNIAIKAGHGGSGYYLGAPQVTINGNGVGSGATATAVVSPEGVVTSVLVTNQGEGYTVKPTVTFTLPSKDAAPELNVEISFSGQFYAYAVTPVRDTNKSVVDRKRIDVDYRLVLTDKTDEDLASTLFPNNAFNTQMEGQTLSLSITKIKLPHSTSEETVSISQTFTIKKVLDSKTVVLDNPFYYQIGKDQFISDISEGECTCTYRYVKYNTQKESNKQYQPNPDVTPVNVNESYAEVTYRDLKTFSGFVSRHKLYARSLFYPGDFNLISDEPLGAIELLTDTVTFNKAFNVIGKFYNQTHIEKYYFPSATDVILEAKTTPIDSLEINGGDPSTMDGSKYVIIKNDSIGITNDNVYYPYDETEFNDLSGKSYNSNFISLKKDALYVLSTNIIMEKNIDDTDAKLSFYFTSSIADIALEKNYDATYGLKLGDISTKDGVTVKYFNNKQYIYFTPAADYYGTLVLVPYHCNVTLSDLSLKIYGDHGFSPDALFIRVPFKVNVKNEQFEIKAELFDINHNIVFSNLKTTQTFDPSGTSLNQSSVQSDLLSSVFYIESGGTPTSALSSTTTNTDEFTIKGDVYLPDLHPSSSTPIRYVGWEFPNGTGKGKLCYTNVSKLIIDNGDYISLSSVDGGIETTVKSLAIRYDGANNIGRRIYIDQAGNKYNWP